MPLESNVDFGGKPPVYFLLISQLRLVFLNNIWMKFGSSFGSPSNTSFDVLFFGIGKG